MKDGCIPKQSMGGRVVAVSLVTFLLLSMLSVSPPVATHLDMEEKSFNTSAKRVWVHTCTLDHKNAYKNYISRGFKVFKEEEIDFVA